MTATDALTVLRELYAIRDLLDAGALSEAFRHVDIAIVRLERERAEANRTDGECPRCHRLHSVNRGCNRG